MKPALSFLFFFSLAAPITANDSPPVKAQNPNAMPGTLIIAGGGPINAILDSFMEMAGGRNARIVVIPTASIRADQPELQTTYASFRMLEIPVQILHTRDRNQANDPKFVEPLRQATGVWISGGDQSLLIASYKGTLVEKELHRLFANGKVLGGTSAGAAVMSSVAILGGNPVAEVGAGFGLVQRIVVDQHFQNRNRLDRLLGVVGKHPDCIGVGIDERTAIVVKGRTVQVVGDANVSICPPGGNQKENVRVLGAGDEFDLVSMVQMLAIDTAD